MKKSLVLSITGAVLGIAGTVVGLVQGNVSKKEKEEFEREQIRQTVAEYMANQLAESNNSEA